MFVYYGDNHRAKRCFYPLRNYALVHLHPQGCQSAMSAQAVAPRVQKFQSGQIPYHVLPERCYELIRISRRSYFSATPNLYVMVSV